MKLYMPLTAELYSRNEWGDWEDEPTELDGRDLLPYENEILASLVKYRTPEETERGLMHWYGENNSVDDKVKSTVFTVESRNRQLLGGGMPRSWNPLPKELDLLKEYIIGQAADGWGENFEQREIHINEGELYVHLWNSEN